MRSVALIWAIVAAGQVLASQVLASQVLASQDPATSREDPKTIIDRLRSKRFPEADDRLEARDPGARAQMLQEKILEDLGKLLDQNDDGAGREGRGSRRRNHAKDAAAQDPGAGSPTAGRKDRDIKGPPAIGERKGKDGPRGDGMGTDRKDPNKPPALSDLARDVWPPMPARKRQEMDAYGKDKPLPKYEQLLGEYYRTIAEQNKRRDSE